MRVTSILPALALLVLSNADTTNDEAKLSAEILSIYEGLRPPASIAAELVIAIPSSVFEIFDQATNVPALLDSFATEKPEWWEDLPADAKTYLETQFDPKVKQIASILEEEGRFSTNRAPQTSSTNSTAARKTSTMQNVTVTTGTPTPFMSSTAMSLGSSAVLTFPRASLKTSSVANTMSPSVSSVYSTAKAQPTGVIAAGLFSAARVLALAMAL